MYQIFKSDQSIILSKGQIRKQNDKLMYSGCPMKDEPN